MDQRLVSLALVVPNYDEAIDYFTQTLNFDLIENINMGNGKRWVVVKPHGMGGCSILLARAVNEEQNSRIGDQTGGRVFLFLHTDDFWRDYNRMVGKGVTFTEQPREETYGTVVVFKDIFGNKWDLIQPKT